MTASRLVVVLGYSDRRGEDLHEICAARLRRAELETGVNDVVLLSGWARGRSATSEAELMARSWNARCGRLVIDESSRSTLGNVVRAAALVRELSVREVVLVTSGWHGRRAAALLRAVLRGSSAKVTLAVTDEHASRGSMLRELACWAVVPFVTLTRKR